MPQEQSDILYRPRPNVEERHNVSSHFFERRLGSVKESRQQHVTSLRIMILIRE